MTELTISSEEIRSAIAGYVSSLETGTSREEVGSVVDTGDGIAHVEGLASAMANELLEFEGGTLGVALNLDVRDIGVVILGDASKIEEGQTVKRTGEVLSAALSAAVLGVRDGAAVEHRAGVGEHHGPPRSAGDVLERLRELA